MKNYFRFVSFAVLLVFSQSSLLEGAKITRTHTIDLKLLHKKGWFGEIENEEGNYISFKANQVYFDVLLQATKVHSKGLVRSVVKIEPEDRSFTYKIVPEGDLYIIYLKAANDGTDLVSSMRIYLHCLSRLAQSKLIAKASEKGISEKSDGLNTALKAEYLTRKLAMKLERNIWEKWCLANDVKYRKLFKYEKVEKLELEEWVTTVEGVTARKKILSQQSKIAGDQSPKE